MMHDTQELPNRRKYRKLQD